MTIQADLERCLRSPYLRRDETKRNDVDRELEGAHELLALARLSFEEDDEATGLKQAWGAMFRAGRALAYAAGYDVDGLRCLEIVLWAHYVGQGLEEADMTAFRQAQQLVGPPDTAVERAQNFVQKAVTLLRQVAAAQ
ncbi:MAG: hypothetical protein Q9O62_00720 [Ardenticatenia bacterium]|nr:hypothetical protein [Ardenticatenia bacterium]